MTEEKLKRLEASIDRQILQLQKERKAVKQVLSALVEAVQDLEVLNKNEEYITVDLDDAGYIKSAKKLITVLKRPNIPLEVLERGYYRIVDSEVVIDEERMRLLEENE